MLKHAFVSGVSDGADATKVQPSNWNAEHAFDGGTDGAILVRDSGETEGAVWVSMPSAAKGVPVILYKQITEAANVNTDATELGSYELPAGRLAVDSESVVIEAWGNLAANGNSKTITLSFGGTSLVAVSTTASNVGWVLRLEVMRVEESVQVFRPWSASGNSSTVVAQGALTKDLSGAVDIVVTGQSAVASDDIVLKGMTVMWQPAGLTVV